MKFHPSTVKTRVATPLGDVILAATPHGLAGMWFDGQRHQPDVSRWPDAPDHPVLRRAAAQLAQYFAGTRERFELPLDLSAGTEFQQAVWRALLAIESGATSTYGAVGHAIGRPDAPRAVGAAVGRNPISVIVPCHRVMGSSGSLTGYAGGIVRKSALLALEGAPLPATAAREAEAAV